MNKDHTGEFYCFMAVAAEDGANIVCEVREGVKVFREHVKYFLHS